MKVNYSIDELIKKEQILENRSADNFAYDGSHAQIVGYLNELKSLKETEQSKLFDDGFNTAIDQVAEILDQFSINDKLVLQKIKNLKR